MLSRYIQAGLAHARCEWLAESDEYYCEIPELEGVWATGDSEEACRTELQEVLEDWISLGLSLHHELPVLDGINPNLEIAR